MSADLTVPPLYADRDHMALGEHYLRHVDAMTGEGLHAKSAIAAELAWRDRQIASLQARLEAAERDAARWRWLRGNDGSLIACMRADNMHAAIDAVIAATQEAPAAPSEGSQR